MDFLSQNGALLGAGIGILPALLKNLFGSSNPQNFQGTGLSAGDVAAVSPNPTQAVQAYNAAGGDPGSSFGSRLGNLFNGNSSLNNPSSMNSTGMNNTNNNSNPLAGLAALAPTRTSTPGGTTPIQPAVPVAPNYAGTGANPNIGLNGMAGGMPAGLAGGIGGGLAGPSPLAGPAAMNPLLAMLNRFRVG